MSRENLFQNLYSNNKSPESASNLKDNKDSDLADISINNNANNEDSSSEKINTKTVPFPVINESPSDLNKNRPSILIVGTPSSRFFIRHYPRAEGAKRRSGRKPGARVTNSAQR